MSFITLGFLCLGPGSDSSWDSDESSESSATFLIALTRGWDNGDSGM